MNELLVLIEKVRGEMTHLVGKNGLHHPETVECSQRLDELINLLQGSLLKKD